MENLYRSLEIFPRPTGYVAMKNRYTTPITYTYELGLTPKILAGSEYATRNPKDYHCPYVDIYCYTYSHHMNEWQQKLKSWAKSKMNHTFYEKNGCPLRDECEVYALYLFKKQHQGNER